MHACVTGVTILLSGLAACLFVSICVQHVPALTRGSAHVPLPLPTKTWFDYPLTALCACVPDLLPAMHTMILLRLAPASQC
jgi:hypothetical protein